MGKVKALWELEREKRFKEFYDDYIEMGCSHDEAVDCAEEALEQEDVANGQFGVGA